MPSPAYSTRPSRWFRSALFLLAVLVCTLCMQGANAQSDNEEPVVTLDYKLGWVNVESATFGVSILPKPRPNYADGSSWSIWIRYDSTAYANITKISSGWGLGFYDYSSWVLVPDSDLLKTMYFVVHSSGQMNDEETIKQLAIPQSIFYVFSNDFSKVNSGIPLTVGDGYTVNEGVNLAEIPKSSYGPWNSLEVTKAEPVLRSDANESAEQASQSQSVDNKSNTAVTASLDEPLPAPSASASLPDSAEATAVTTSPSSLETVLPPVKFIKGDPNYDPNIDVIGTMLAAPKTGLYLTSIILGIGIIVHAIGTYQRFQYQREYRLSVQQSKDAHFRA
ncbi:hypothetical protein LPJ64_002931 [Coemansia asiatica]|uniref:Uncharacterized protein n=1 Tax=Coemansia asiatica TaxID=1052880 RepID=A0A9W7XIS1_9FUNG|nr:hypothetical protein LPJ64_002931 [Coemansia asiatica]